MNRKIPLLLIAFSLMAVPALAELEAPAGCFQLLEKRCQKCHYLERVCQGVEKKSKRRWKATLKRMVKRRGATLSEEEHTLLLDCLAAPAPDVKEGCSAMKK